MGYLIKPFGAGVTDNIKPSGLQEGFEDIDKAVTVLTRKIKHWLCELDLSVPSEEWIREFKKPISLENKTSSVLPERHLASEIITQLPNLIRLRDAKVTFDVLLSVLSALGYDYKIISKRVA